MIWFRALGFVLLVQLTMIGLVPWVLVHRALSTPHPVLTAIGLGLMGSGLATLIWCNVTFVRRGLGTASPHDPPKVLVVAGLYRYVRNPMYLAAIMTVLGEALATRQSVLAGYATVLAMAYHLFVRYYEEPHLRTVFGSAYEQYCASVSRWVPRRPST